MKKALSIMIMLSAIILTSCGDGNKGAASKIIGHYYCNPNVTANPQFHFIEDGSATYTYWDYSYNFHTVSHLVYTISGKRVEVKYDNSGYWTDGQAGQLLRGFTYHPSDNTLIADDGERFIMLLSK